MLTYVRAGGGRQVVERFLSAPRVERWWGCEGAVSVPGIPADVYETVAAT